MFVARRRTPYRMAQNVSTLLAKAANSMASNSHATRPTTALFQN
jgi:hypothetical protein